MRLSIIEYVNHNLTDNDKPFLISFEEGTPKWEITDYTTFKDYPSVQWKLFNIDKLKRINPLKHKQEVERLRGLF
jgi:hypothetical protein